MQADHEWPSDGRAGAAKNTAKIFEKLFKNLLTNRKECGIITRSPMSGLRGTPRADHWQLNNRRLKYKHSLWRISKFLWKKNLKSITDLRHTQQSIKSQTSSTNKVLTATAVWIQFAREFDPGSGWTLAACITHSSRTRQQCLVADGWVTREQPALVWGIPSGNGR